MSKSSSTSNSIETKDWLDWELIHRMKCVAAQCKIVTVRERCCKGHNLCKKHASKYSVCPKCQSKMSPIGERQMEAWKEFCCILLEEGVIDKRGKLLGDEAEEAK
uniref:Uncharacterized protein n=1 Tax=Cacopsylla melanoneura TaxID=428564 RepID=A0A8D8U494_9HEMI